MDDMILTKVQMDTLFSEKRRNGLKGLQFLWPNKTVPVLISDEFGKLRSQPKI